MPGGPELSVCVACGRTVSRGGHLPNSSVAVLSGGEGGSVGKESLEGLAEEHSAQQ
jgi:hypothetical protein